MNKETYEAVKIVLAFLAKPEGATNTQKEVDAVLRLQEWEREVAKDYEGAAN